MGKLIVIDGLDGSGKNTQSHLFCDHLGVSGKRTRLLSFPNYHTPACAPVEQYLSGAYGSDPETVNCYAASAFYAVDRYSSYMLDWKKDYESDCVVVANRYTTSNAIHQMAKLPESEADGFLSWLYDFEFCRLGIPRPDLTLFLDVPVNVSLSLIEKRGEKKDIHEVGDHLEKARKAAFYACEKLGWTRIECTENGKMLPVEAITSLIVKAASDHV